ncbi:hypothetical protein [uncultured Tateyamaria sp.]|nr:hypothetical protein [uncultured Tateyamaria sp.]
MPQTAQLARSRSAARVDALMFSVSDGGTPNNPAPPVPLIRRAVTGSADQTDRVINEAGGMPLEVAQTRIAAVTRPATDPIFGADGPTLHHWKKDRTHGP